MTHPSVSRDKSTYKQQKKPLTTWVPAQLARNMPQTEYTLLERRTCKVQSMPLEVLLASEVKSRSNKSNPIPADRLAVGQKHWPDCLPLNSYPPWHHTLFIRLGISPTSCLIVGNNPLNLILLVVTCHNRIWGPLGPTR